MFRCLCSENSSVLKKEARYYFSVIPLWVGSQRAREFLLESCGFCPVRVAEIKVLAVASAGYPLILRGCGPDLTVGARRSVDFLKPRCGWGNQDQSIETAPGRSEVARIKLH